MHPSNLPKQGLFFTLIFIFASSSFLSAQWLDWQDITDTNLTLTTVANSDDEEKDMSAADFNNDGYTDVIVVRKEPFSNPTENEKSDLLLMNENGQLVDRTTEYAPEFLTDPTYARDVVVADLDYDGWLDIVIANTFVQEPKYYRNLGEDAAGDWLGFVEEGATRFPLMDEGDALICAVWAGDIDGDTYDDLYFVNYKQSAGSTAKDYLFINDGTGNFTNESETRLGDLRNSAFGTAVEIHDMDNDGDMDILKTSVLFNVSPWNSGGLFLLYNDGTGNFTDWQKISPTTASYMFTVDDINLDGKLDLYVVDDQTDYQLIAGTIIPDDNITYTDTDINSSRINGFGGNVHKADLDLDGYTDFAVADVDVDIPPCNSARTFAIFQNDAGSVIDPYPSPPSYNWEGNVYDYCFFDLNNDGLQDVLLGRCDGYDLLLNDNCDLVVNGSDFDLDGLADACDPCPSNPDPACVPDSTFPTVDPSLNIARKWNEMLLSSIRADLARPTVHARNLFHESIALWDSWAVYNDPACLFLLGRTVDGFTCTFDGINVSGSTNDAIESTMSYASYRLLTHRFANSPNASNLQDGYDNLMMELGFDTAITSIDYSDNDPAKLGNYLADCIINFGNQDGANEANAYENTSYLPINDPMVIDNPGNPDITDYNRWQPLTLDIFIDQSGNVIPGATPEFLSAEWGEVTPFALKEEDKNIYTRNGYDYEVYHDPGAPPYMNLSGTGDTDQFTYGVATVILWSSHLDPTDNVMWDISPGNMGNGANLPSDFSAFPSYYDQLNGGTAANGHPINPSTGSPYASNMVPRGDFARVLAEFWADGPDSETPPGHWFSILNYVADHPDFQKRFEGSGPIMDETEWYVKGYLAMGGAMHDAAVTAWGIKGWYDYIRPISAIRAMADLGQSSDSGLPNYHPSGLPLLTNYIELIQTGDPLAGDSDEHVDKIKIWTWLGHETINNVDTDEAGVGWIRAEDWVPYQRPSFVTPPFAGYVSGHSTYSRAAAEVLTLYTGDEFFPGGMGTFLAEEDEFLVFEDGPSVDVELQWATYRDAADQSGLSRIWGGIHPPADDVPGRILGITIGIDAYMKARRHFIDFDNNGTPEACDDCDDIRIFTLTNGANDDFNWQASDYIEATNLIENGADIIYDAGNHIDLLPGFEVEMNAEFDAIIDGCVENP